MNNIRPTLGNWHFERDTAGARTDQPNMFARSRSVQVAATPDFRAGALIPWRPSEERSRTGPSGLAGRFSGQALSEAYPGARQMSQVSPPTPGFTGQGRNLEENSGLTRNDHDKGSSKKFRKEIYNPSPKRISRRLSLYYRDNRKNILNGTEKDRGEDDDDKRCPICWEDFEAREEVMLTPCNHMFHENCIMPWVKTQAHCPVCRFAFADQMLQIRETTTTTTTSNLLANNNNNVAYVAPTHSIAVEDFIAILRAMDEALQWG